MATFYSPTKSTWPSAPIRLNKAAFRPLGRIGNEKTPISRQESFPVCRQSTRNSFGIEIPAHSAGCETSLFAPRRNRASSMRSMTWRGTGEEKEETERFFHLIKRFTDPRKCAFCPDCPEKCVSSYSLCTLFCARNSLRRWPSNSTSLTIPSRRVASVSAPQKPYRGFPANADCARMDSGFAQNRLCACRALSSRAIEKDRFCPFLLRPCTEGCRWLVLSGVPSLTKTSPIGENTSRW